MSGKRLVARNVAATLATQLVSWSLTVAVMLYLPRYLGADGLGKLAVVGSLIAICSVLVPLGTSAVLIKDIARERSRTGELLAAAVALRIPLGFLATGLAAGTAFLLGYSDAIRLLIWLSAVGMIIGSVNEAVGAALQGQENMSRLSLGTLTDKFLASGLIIALVFAKAPLWAFVVVGLVTSTVSLLVNLTAFRTLLPTLRRPSLLQIRRMAAAGVPYLGWAVFSTLNGQADPLIIHPLTNLATVGWYTAAYKIIGTTMFLPTAISTALLPTLSRLYVEDRDRFDALARRTLTLIMLCAVPVAAALIVAPDRLIALLHLQSQFENTAPVLRWGGAAILLWYPTTFIAGLVVACDRQHAMLKASMIATAIAIPACILGTYATARISANGATGAMISDGVVEAYLLLAYLKMLPPKTFRADSLLQIGRLVAAAGPPMLLFALASGGPYGFLMALPCAALYVLLCWLLRGLNASDIAMLRTVFAQKAGA